MGLFETPDQERAWTWQRIQQLREERIDEMELEEMSRPGRMEEIIALIRKLEARYKELGGILYGSYAPETEGEDE